ncbi:hypothetical protein, partial [Serratia marcescens]|uniref:hypothetical protein n=1 Tax=Serratia marcescens TaxID=615 RepID=UPI001953B4EE
EMMSSIALAMGSVDSIVDNDFSFLELCYVKNADRMMFDNRIEMHLQKREPLFNSQPKRPLE